MAFSLTCQHVYPHHAPVFLTLMALSLTYQHI
jgi:hypothetical protein